jgi:hypothetical protein
MRLRRWGFEVFISLVNNYFWGSLRLVMLGRSSAHGCSLGRSSVHFVLYGSLYGWVLTVLVPPWRIVEWTFSAVITWCWGWAAEPHSLYFLCTCQIDE